MDFNRKLVLAPMVRCGSLPMRLLAIRYGADLVYSPELIDKRIVKTTRRFNEKLGTFDYIDPHKNSLCLRVHPTEISKLIIQIGSSDPAIAVEAGLKMQNDCSAIDLNCGCPKKFSLQGGMGAALLDDIDKLCDILRALVNNLSVPVTCKIRILPNHNDTLNMIRRITETGISALAIHCRTKDMKSTTPVIRDILKDVSSYSKIPIIANGDIFSPTDIRELEPYVSSFMLARGALINPSIFSLLSHYIHSTPRTSILDPYLILQEYIKLGIQFDLPYSNIKYTLCQMAPPPKSIYHEALQTKLGLSTSVLVRLAKTGSLREMALLFGCEEFFDNNSDNSPTLLMDNEASYIPDSAYPDTLDRNI